MTAQPGSGDYGSLSIFLAATGNVKRIRVLKPSVFWPRPQVDSAMVVYIHDEAKSGRIRDMKIFSEIVRLFMGHRRKTLSACTKLAGGGLAAVDNWPGILEECSIDPADRPERLRPEDYIAVANLCAASLSRAGQTGCLPRQSQAVDACPDNAIATPRAIYCRILRSRRGKKTSPKRKRRGKNRYSCGYPLPYGRGL